MAARLSTGLVIAALAGTLLSACGGGSTPSSSSSSTPSSSSSTTSPAGEKSSTAPSTTVSVPAGVTAKELVAECKATVAAEPQIPPGAKAKAEQTCDAAAHGSVQAAQKAAYEVCEQVVEATGLSLEYREKLIAGCKARTK